MVNQLVTKLELELYGINIRGEGARCVTKTWYLTRLPPSFYTQNKNK